MRERKDPRSSENAIILHLGWWRGSVSARVLARKAGGEKKREKLVILEIRGGEEEGINN